MSAYDVGILSKKFFKNDGLSLASVPPTPSHVMVHTQPNPPNTQHTQHPFRLFLCDGTPVLGVYGPVASQFSSVYYWAVAPHGGHQQRGGVMYAQGVQQAF